MIERTTVIAMTSHVPTTTRMVFTVEYFGAGAVAATSSAVMLVMA